MEPPASIRAAILLSLVLDAPFAARAARRATGKPRVTMTEVGATTVEITSPDGAGPWPAWVFVSGAHPERRREPVVQRLTDGLARAGFLVVAPDPPGLGEGEITGATLESVVAVTRGATQRADARGGRVALLGASTGASLVLLAAAHPELRERVSVVVAVTPFADLEKIVCLATTRSYGDAPERLVVNELLRSGVQRSLVAGVSDEGDRRTLLGALEAAGGEAERLRASRSDVGAEARAVVDVLLNDHPVRFPRLYADLSAALRETVDLLSPLRVAADVSAPVELVVPPKDEYFPHEEALSLARSLPRVRLTVTPTLDHTRPTLSLQELGALARFTRFAVRGLAAAART